MDAIRFLEELKRMFKSGSPVPGLNIDTNYDSEKVVKIVEEWSATHPKKTRQDVFLEQWPNVELDGQDVIVFDPCDLDKTMRCNNSNCEDCRRKFWTQEVK